MKIYLVYNPVISCHLPFMNELNLNILASYYFLRKKNPMTKPYLLDSGAFSAFTTGETINN